MELEAELMLLGNWKNFDDLEDSLSYPELVAMVEAQREKEKRNMKFQAAMQGIDLDKDKQEDDPVERVKRNLRAKQEGLNPEVLKMKDAATAAGFKVEIE